MVAIVLYLLDYMKWCKQNEDYMEGDDDMTIDLIPPLHYNIPPLVFGKQTGTPTNIQK